MLITKDNIKDFSLGLSLSSGDVVQFDIDCYLLEYVYTSDVEGCKLSFRGDANGIFNATPNPDYVVTEGGMLGTVLRLLGCCAADIKVFYRLVYGPDSKLVFPYFPLACLRSTFKAACAPMYTLNAVVMVFKLMGYSVHPSFDLGPEFYEFMVKIRDLSYNGRSDFVLGSRFAVGQKLHLADIDVLRRYHADKVLLLSAGSAVVVSQVYRVRYSYIFTSGDLDDCVRYTFFIGNTPFFVPMHYFKECHEFSIKNNYGEECKDASGLQESEVAGLVRGVGSGCLRCRVEDRPELAAVSFGDVCGVLRCSGASSRVKVVLPSRS
jgi:hypothetical protein